MHAELGGLWTTVASARELQNGSLEQLCPFAHLWIDRLRRAEISDRESGPLWHLHAFTTTWLRPGLPARIELSKEVFPVLPRTEHTHVVRVHSLGTDNHLDACSAVGKSDPLHTSARLPVASAICWRTSQNRGRIPPVFHTLILPKCTRMFASRLMYFFWDHVQIIKEREQPLASTPTDRAGPMRTEEA